MSDEKDRSGDGILAAAVSTAFSFVSRPDRAWAREWLLRGLDGDHERDIVALKNTEAFVCGEIVEMYVVATPTPRDDLASRSTGKLCELLQLQTGEKTTPSAATFSRFLWMPSHYHGGLTCGVSLQRVNAVSGLPNSIETLPQPGEPGLFLVGRFVREERTGECLIIAACSAAGMQSLAAISYLMNKSPTRRHHMFLQCKKSVLAGVRSQPFHFAHAAVFADVSVTEHDCSVCGISPLAVPPCQCITPTVAPSGSLDFAQFQANSRRNLGVSCGKTFLLQRSGAVSHVGMRKLSQSVVMTLARMQGPSNNTIAMSMRALAIQERLSQSPLRISDGVSDVFENDDVLDFDMEAELEAEVGAGLKVEKPAATCLCPGGLGAYNRVEHNPQAQHELGVSSPAHCGVHMRPLCYDVPAHLAPAVFDSGTADYLGAPHQAHVQATGYSRSSRGPLHGDAGCTAYEWRNYPLVEQLRMQNGASAALSAGAVPHEQALPSHPAYQGLRPVVHVPRSEHTRKNEINACIGRGAGPALVRGLAWEARPVAPLAGVDVDPAATRVIDRQEKNRT